MSDPVDLTQFEDYYESVDLDILDDETAPRTGLRVPTTRTSRSITTKTVSGPIVTTVFTWNEVATVRSIKMGQSRPEDPMREYGSFWLSIGLTISKDPIYDNFNRGANVTELLRFYPKLIDLSDDECKRIKAISPEKSPLRYLKNRKIENAKAHRILGSLVAACGFQDRLTKRGGLRLPAVADLLALEGKGLQNIPVRAEFERGRPDWYGNIAEQVLIGFKVVS